MPHSTRPVLYDAITTTHLSMQPALPRLRHVLLTPDQVLDLHAHLVQPPQHLFVSVHEPQQRVRDPCLGAKLHDQRLQPAQVVPRHTREQVVHGLELKTAVDPVEPRRAVDVHRGAELALGEGLGFAEVRGRHGPVGEGDLDVKGHSDNVRDEDEADADGPRGERAPDEEVAKDVPVAGHHGDFGGADPPGGRVAEGRGLGREEVQPREEVEVEARHAHDGVVRVLLEGDEEVGGGVPDEGEVVVGGEDAAEKGGRGGEEGDVLDIGVVFLGGLAWR